MKLRRMKKLLLAVSGLAIYQVAGCGLSEQLIEQLQNFQNIFQNLPGMGG